MAILILEGVTGSGKSSTVRALQACAAFKLYDEDATFDDFLTQFWDNPGAAAGRAVRRFASILTEIEKDPSQNCLLERFHFSPIAVGSDLAWYQAINERCAALGCKVAALTIPEEELRLRALNRKEYCDKDWQFLIARYGSVEASLGVLRAAQRRRVEAIGASGLPSLLIDTSAMAWDDYAAQIARWAGWVRADDLVG
jgi:hypothetical protein